MAVARRSRTLAVPPEDVWSVVSDPHHMPRWWPGVARVEGVTDDRFTQVFKTRKGRSVRLDFEVIESEAPRVRTWQQEIAGTPFERVLNLSIVSIELEPSGEGTRVRLNHEQKLRGYSRTGGFMLKRATGKKLDEALDDLERICG